MIEWVSFLYFKSLGQPRSATEINLSKFNCLIGMNGSGKTTILQGLSLIAQVMRGDVNGWLDERGWEIGDLASTLHPRQNIHLNVRYRTSEGVKVAWSGIMKRGARHCSSELVVIDDTRQLWLVDGKLDQVGDEFHLPSIVKGSQIIMDYQGSILSHLKEEFLPKSVLEMRDALRQTRSLELLSPDLLRKRARNSDDSGIGTGGEKLSAFLSQLTGDKRKELIELLGKFYPNIDNFKITNQRSGWKKLTIIERFDNKTIETEARHLNDGLLRVLAILAQTKSSHPFILLDEIENGINPEIVAPLVDALVQSPQQMLVTTHSPMILNYLDDDTARESVQFVYKGPDGSTRVRRFFDIERINRKLDVMGPGEAFVDTDLRALTQECVQLDAQQQTESPLQHKVTKDSTT